MSRWGWLYSNGLVAVCAVNILEQCICSTQLLPPPGWGFQAGCIGLRLTGLKCDGPTGLAQCLQARFLLLLVAVQVLWNKARGAEALSTLLYGPKESGGLALVPPVDTAKGASGRLSTDKAALQSLVTQHPIPGIILQFRKLAHNLAEMHSRIAAADAAAAAAAASGSSRGAATAADDAAAAASGLVRVRCTWLQTCHAGGRLSSEGVRTGDNEQGSSLQCVAKNIQYELHSRVAAAQAGANAELYADSDDESDGEEDKEPPVLTLSTKPAPPSQPAPAAAAAAAAEGGAAAGAGQQASEVQVLTASVRSGFAAPAGCVILAADYNQMEFRLMAHFSKDPSLLKVRQAASQPGCWRCCLAAACSTSSGP